MSSWFNWQLIGKSSKIHPLNFGNNCHIFFQNIYFSVCMLIHLCGYKLCKRKLYATCFTSNKWFWLLVSPQTWFCVLPYYHDCSCLAFVFITLCTSVLKFILCFSRFWVSFESRFLSVSGMKKFTFIVREIIHERLSKITKLEKDMK